MCMYTIYYLFNTLSSHMQHSDNRATVYVSNTQHHFGDHDLQELFQQVKRTGEAPHSYVCMKVCMKPDLHLFFQCGPLKEVRLVKNRAGKSKEFAYIEYLNEVYYFKLRS